MATQNKIGVGVTVSDNGTVKKVVKNVEELRSTIKKTQATAEKGINIPGGTSGGTSGGTPGSRKVAAAAAPQGAAAAAAPQGSAALMQYGNLRGSAGATGAAGRDFANQAQGLGGLVRLYATYAANIFAVGAAFNALSSAMDTSNMIKGLDQLGAASGTALGSLSKRFVEATDGAVSLREAMESVTKASSAGMSDTDILRIATSAKQAAQALGVDMSDAVSRLTRGITKMEPELLDELGIFVRVDDVVNAYAKSVNKSASALTDFERRMAYSNATLTQAEKKFGEIKLDTNPYTQLLAVIKDTSQSVLELVNVALVPLVKLLSSSPTALLAVLGTVGVGLVKQAVPALSDYRKSLEAMSEAAKETAKSRLQDLKSSLGAELATKIKALDDIAQAEAEAVLKTSDKMAKAGKKVKKYDTKAYEISQKELNKVTEAEIEYLEQLSTKGKKISGTYGDMALNLRNYTEAEKQYNVAKAEQNTLLTRGSSLWTTVGQNELEYHTQVNNARKRGMVSSTAYTASTKGLVAGLRESWANFKAAGESTTTTIDVLNAAGAKTGATFSVVTGKLGLFSRGMLLARLATISTVAAIGTAVNAFLPWIQVIGLVVAAGGALISWMSKNTEEAENFKTALDSANSSIKTLGETLDFINKKPFGQQLNTESLEASAKAFGEVGSSVKTLVQNLEKVDKAAGVVDKFIDGFAIAWGEDIRSKFATSMTSTIIGALNTAANTAEGSKARSRIANLLSIDPKFTADTFNKAIAGAAGNTLLLEKVYQAIEEIGIQAGIAASRSRELDDSLKASADAYKAVTDQFTSKDPLAALGASLVISSQKLAQAIKDPNTALQKFAEIASDIDKLKLFGKEDQTLLTKYSKQLNDVVSATAEQAKSVEELRKQEEQLEALRAKGGVNPYTGKGYTDAQIALGDSSFEKILASTTQLRKDIASGDVRLAKARKDVENVVNKFPEIAANQLQKGADLIYAGIVAASAKSSNIFREAVVSSLGDIPGVARAREKIELSKIASDNQLIKSQRELTKAVMENSIAVQLASARTALANLETLPADAFREGRISQSELPKAAKLVKDLEAKERIVKSSPKQGIDILVAQVRAGNTEIAADAEKLMSYLNSLASSSAALSANAQQARAVQYTRIINEIKEQFKIEEDALKKQKEAAQTEGQRLANLETISTVTSADLINAQEANKRRLVELDTEEKLLAIKKEKTLYDKAVATGLSGQNQKEQKAKQEEFEKRPEDASAAAQVQFQTIALETSKKQLALRTEEIKRTSELATKQKEIQDILQDTKNTTAEILQTTAEETNLYSDKYLQSIKDVREAKEAEFNAQRLREQESSAFKAQEKLNLENLAELELTGATDAATKLREDMELASSLHETKLYQIEEEKQARLNAIEEVAKYREEREDFTSMIEAVTALDTLWSGVGTSIATVLTAQDEMATSQKQLAAEIKNLTSKRDAATDAKEKIEWQKKIDKTTVKSQKDEIAGYAKTVGAAKGMFKEKTTAHKALAATEKVLHLQRLAMDLKEMVQRLFTDSTEVASTVTAEAAKGSATTAGFLSRAGNYISEIFASFSASMGPWGWAAAAGVVAAIFGGSGKGSAPAFTPSAEQRQETQGTAMGWDSTGNKVQVRRGVFGDTDAKSESIANSLEIIKDTTIDGLSYDNKMVKLLESIDNGINKTARGLYGIAGLRSGSMFGTFEGESKGGGLLGLGLFGSKTTKNISDSGLVISGSFADLAKTTNKASLDFFEQVNVTKKKWYGSSKSWVETNITEVNDATSEFFQDIFGNATKLFIEMASKTGTAESTVTNILENLDLGKEFISLRGLKGEELQTELASIIGTILDQGAEAIFSQFLEFAEFGEGMLETVVRVIDTNDKISQAVTNMGFSVNLTRLYGITESLTAAAGGLEEFLNQTRFFTENFLSEAEQLVPVQRAVANEMARLAALGYTAADGLVDTRKEFKLLVQGLDLTDAKSREAYQALMNVQEGFIRVTESMEEGLNSTIDKFTEFSSNLKGFRDNLVLGSNSILTPLQKYAESKLQFEETYAKALAGDADAQSGLESAANAFLGASKGYFASSGQYTQDVNTVLDKIGVGISEADRQISIAQQQLDGTNTQVGLLTSINDNIGRLVAESGIGPFNTLDIPQLARGGLGQGVTLVGEDGAELVDFTQPGRVYTADQTAGMFAPKAGMSNNIYEVVAELRQVKQELAQLRQEQKQQTGDLIVSNYDANNRAAQAVAGEIAETANTKEWQVRNAPAIV